MDDGPPAGLVRRRARSILPPALDADGGMMLELRQIFEAEDFGAEFTPELREREECMRTEIEGT